MPKRPLISCALLVFSLLGLIPMAVAEISRPDNRGLFEEEMHRMLYAIEAKNFSPFMGSDEVMIAPSLTESADKPHFYLDYQLKSSLYFPFLGMCHCLEASRSNRVNVEAYRHARSETESEGALTFSLVCTDQTRDTIPLVEGLKNREIVRKEFFEWEHEVIQPQKSEMALRYHDQSLGSLSLDGFRLERLFKFTPEFTELRLRHGAAGWNALTWGLNQDQKNEKRVTVNQLLGEAFFDYETQQYRSSLMVDSLLIKDRQKNIEFSHILSGLDAEESDDEPFYLSAHLSVDDLYLSLAKKPHLNVNLGVIELGLQAENMHSVALEPTTKALKEWVKTTWQRPDIFTNFSLESLLPMPFLKPLSELVQGDTQINFHFENRVINHAMFTVDFMVNVSEELTERLADPAGFELLLKEESFSMWWDRYIDEATIEIVLPVLYLEAQKDQLLRLFEEDEMLASWEAVTQNLIEAAMMTFMLTEPELARYMNWSADEVSLMWHYDDNRWRIGNETITTEQLMRAFNRQ